MTETGAGLKIVWGWAGLHNQGSHAAVHSPPLGISPQQVLVFALLVEVPNASHIVRLLVHGNAVPLATQLPRCKQEPAGRLDRGASDKQVVHVLSAEATCVAKLRLLKSACDPQLCKGHPRRIAQLLH